MFMLAENKFESQIIFGVKIICHAVVFYLIRKYKDKKYFIVIVYFGENNSFFKTSKKIILFLCQTRNAPVMVI